MNMDKVYARYDLLEVSEKWGLYMDAVNEGYVSYDDTIYSMDEFDGVMEGRDPTWVACRVIYGDFNPIDDYFMFNGYGNCVSMSNYDVNKYIDDYHQDEVIQYMVDTGLYLDDMDEEEEEEEEGK